MIRDAWKTKTLNTAIRSSMSARAPMTPQPILTNSLKWPFANNDCMCKRWPLFTSGHVAALVGLSLLGSGRVC